jgi:DNA-binding MarR family transcriptional regulator
MQISLEMERLMPRAMSMLFSIEGDELSEQLSAAQLRVVRLLQNGPLSSGDLGALLGLSPSSVTQMIARLEQHGFVEKQTSERDRRMRTIRLSQSGDALMQRRSEARAQKAAETLKTMDLEEIELMLELVKKLAKPGQRLALEEEAIV